MLKKDQIIELNIHDLGASGEGVGRFHGLTVFVEGALPEELVRTRISAVKPRFAIGGLQQILNEAPERVAPLCSHYADCGGCQIMHLSYQQQLIEKRNAVKSALKHIGGLADIAVLPCIPSPEVFHYRNKIQLPVQEAVTGVVTGFYQKGSHDIVPYERCLIHHRSMEEVVKHIRLLLSRSSVKPYCEKTGKGTLRHLVIRSNEEGRLLLGLVTTGRQLEEVRKLARQLMALNGDFMGIVNSINRDHQNKILGDEHISLVGEPFLLERIDGLNFKISLPSFFQVNLAAAKLLYDTALSFADLDNHKCVLDAYCGIGTLSLLAAKKAKRVIGIEAIEQAVRDAKENAQINQIENAYFMVARVEDETELFKDVDITLINPPRKGLDAKVALAISRFGSPKVIYISCNPATLARDLRLLQQSYSIGRVQPVDMFPQTMHVETVVELNRLER